MKSKGKFLSSGSTLWQCPETNLPEYAFMGRSNVGKSSLINMLLGEKLARTSSQPGKTRSINYFSFLRTSHLVDLPGYGYAKAPQSERKIWFDNLKEYILKRDILVCTFVLLDFLVGPQKSDLEFMDWLVDKKIPFAIIFTKIDKPKRNEANNLMFKYKAEMLKDWKELPLIFMVSSNTGSGKKELQDFIRDTSHEFKKMVSSNNKA